jgi:hypothetical protein
VSRSPQRLPKEQFAAGAIVLALGLGACFGWIPALSAYAYPVAWWGLIAVADSYNFRRCGLSLWRGNAPRFLLITLPLSVLFWLLFEALNLVSPQWTYRGTFFSLPTQILFGFASFATVIPILVEAYWLVLGGICFPPAITGAARRAKAVWIAAAIAMLVIPLFRPVFWLSQGMWIAPAILLAPFLTPAPCVRSGRFWTAVAVAGLLSGFFWEMLNFWAGSRWEYLILPDIPHLFAMPLPGYLGFIPFGLACVVLYHWHARVPPRAVIGAALYLAAFAGLWALTSVHLERVSAQPGPRQPAVSRSAP